MGEEWEQTLRAMGEASSNSNPVQRYGRVQAFPLYI